jgi:hypothetical protein
MDDRTGAWFAGRAPRWQARAVPVPVAERPPAASARDQDVPVADE